MNWIVIGFLVVVAFLLLKPLISALGGIGDATSKTVNTVTGAANDVWTSTKRAACKLDIFNIVC